MEEQIIGVPKEHQAGAAGCGAVLQGISVRRSTRGGRNMVARRCRVPSSRRLWKQGSSGEKLLTPGARRKP